MAMKRSFFPFLFSLAIFGIFCLPNFLHAQGIDFYSRIDDAGDSLAFQLTSRYLDDYSTFEGFGKNCRPPLPWLDNSPMDEQMLIDLSLGNFSSFQHLLQEKNQTLSSPFFVQLTSCLRDTYQTFQKDSARQQSQLNTASLIGIFMDGDVKNSDFDLVHDISRINEIIFTQKEDYNGKKNETSDALTKFLKGKAADIFGKKSEKTSAKIENNQNLNKNRTGEILSEKNIHTSHENRDELPWENSLCTPEGTVQIGAIVDKNFQRDLQKTLLGKGNSQSSGSDYSERKNISGDENTQKNAGHSSENGKKNEDGKDFFHKLPCNGIFCITITSVWHQHNLLGGGNRFSIESILDAHIKKLENISWGDLSAQKMTKNSFELPFLNVKIKDKIAGGRIYMHTLPQITKKFESEETPEKKDAEFDRMYRCALVSA